MARPVSRAGASRGANPALRLAAIRQFHSYLGAFVAPSVLFFAATGSVQLFSLHEAHGSYTPPPLIEKLSAVHKDQRFAVAKPKHAAPPPAGARHAEAEPAEAADHDHGHAHPAMKSTRELTLKWLFLAVAVSLIVSTCLGLWMAMTYSKRKAVIWTLLILGAGLPILILTV